MSYESGFQDPSRKGRISAIVGAGLLLAGIIGILVLAMTGGSGEAEPSAMPGATRLLPYLALLFLAILPGGYLLWSSRRRKRESPEEQRLGLVKDQIVWTALAQGGRITAAKAAQMGVAPMEAEHALMSLVSEGRATVAANESGELIYRIDSTIGELDAPTTGEGPPESDIGETEEDS